MSNPPFGFGPPPGDEPEKASNAGGESPDNPFAALFGAGAPGDIGAAFQRIGQLLSYSGGPVNWDLARDTARQVVAAGTDRSVSAGERSAVTEAVRLAELWLDAATALPSGVTSSTAWSRAEWVEETLATWRQLVDPVATKVVEGMGNAMPAEMAAVAGPLVGMMRQMGGAMFGAQVGQALGQLAGEVVGSTDVGLPLGPAGRAALLPANVAAFGEGLEVPADQVRLYLALREAAYHRLFAHVPWLRGHLLAALEAYARGITVDTSRLQEAMNSLDPSDPEGLARALGSGMFEPQTTPAQQAALDRLETTLALVEGWVDEVVDTAASPHLPSAAALRETVRRRRATGGPAEATFASLVGLELRPRRLRDAAALWRAVGEARGTDGRDAVWAHPDLLPTAEDLDDPSAFVDRRALDLSALEDSQAPPEPPEPPEPPTGES